ncbi:hypothetical protein [Nostoc sp. GT001]|uniref:hypothetical protein n=1 Tax=Nostoc sp. GT001 TaxID=3056647 RepID=UPI0025AB03FE|nr:hypothetical protein [Nostoc sp. GT001]MDM9583742.1 hypothetical protein [Nostoc sp. GT001]
MNENKDYLEVIGDFLIRFYHEEPDDLQASIKAVETMTSLFDYEWEVATAFRNLLEMELPPGQIRDLVRLKANRYAQNDDDAREFLKEIYQSNDLENAINFKDYED